MAEEEKKDKLGDTEDKVFLGDSKVPDEKGESGSEEDLAGLSGSEAGLLDLELRADDTSFGGVFDEVYAGDGVQIQPPRAPSKRALQARASLGKRIYYHDDIMAGEGFRRVRDYCYTDGIKYILFAKDKEGKPSIFVMSGYSLKDIVTKGKTMRDIQFVGEGNKVINSYAFFDRLAKTYLAVDGRRGEGIAPDNEYFRVAFGYSVGYNPDDQKNLKAKIRSTIKDANEVYGKMKSDIEKNLGGGKAITRISGDATFNLCMWVCGVYRQKKGAEEPLELIEEPAEPSSLAEAIQEVEEVYRGDAATRRKGETVSADGQPWYKRIPFLGGSPKKNKPKR